MRFVRWNRDRTQIIQGEARCNKRSAVCNPNWSDTLAWFESGFDRNSRGAAKRLLAFQPRGERLQKVVSFFFFRRGGGGAPSNGRGWQFETRRFYECNCTSCNVSRIFERGFVTLRENFAPPGLSLYLLLSRFFSSLFFFFRSFVRQRIGDSPVQRVTSSDSPKWLNIKGKNASFCRSLVRKAVRRFFCSTKIG